MEEVGEPVFVMQLAITHQQHDRHGSELFGARGKTEIRARTDFAKRTQIQHAVATLEHDASVLEDEHGCPRGTGGFKPGENLLDALFLDSTGGHRA